LSIAGAVRITSLAGIVLLASTWTGAAPARALTPAVVKQDQELVTLLISHQVRSKPAAASPPLRLVRARTPITEDRTVLPVLGHRTGNDKLRWLHVMLPGRPNGSTGWISQRATVSSWTEWHLVVHTSARRVTVYRHSRLVRAFKAVVGKASTPTPHGRFYVEEAIQLPANAAGAPYALALSARSTVLQEFSGGPGQIALHGLTNVGGTLGTAVSHGCVRLDNDAMRWLVKRVGPGVPVTIKR
jgi:lipoprotein-anchoring transpeptidase ErfK/SrfK